MNREEKQKKAKKAEEINKLRSFRIILTILCIILISLISFGGIYVENKNQMKNLIPDFILGSDVKGNRVIELQPETEKTEIIKDKDGKEITRGTATNLSNQGYTDESISSQGYTKEEEPTNKEEDLTEKNYEKTKEIIEKRLQDLKVTDYKVRQNPVNGNIIVEMKEDTNTDQNLSTIYQVGKFEVVDSETKEALLTNDNVKNAKVVYQNGQSGINVYLEIVFNKNGKKKLEDISKAYTNSVSNTAAETNTANTLDANTLDANNVNEASLALNETSNTTNETTSQTTTNKKVDITIDGTAIAKSQQFSEVNSEGKLDLLIGSGSGIDTSDQNNKLTKYMAQAASMSTLLNTQELPLTYKVNNNKYIESSISTDTIKDLLIGMVAIAILAYVVLIFKFKLNGILMTISNVGLIAFVLALLRFTNVEMGIGGILGLGLVQIFNYIFSIMVLKAIKNKKENVKIIKNILVKYSLIIVPAYILAITFAFSTFIPIYSFGMVLFWGLTSIVIYNLIITKGLLEKA